MSNFTDWYISSIAVYYVIITFFCALVILSEYLKVKSKKITENPFTYLDIIILIGVSIIPIVNIIVIIPALYNLTAELISGISVYITPKLKVFFKRLNKPIIKPGEDNENQT